MSVITKHQAFDKFLQERILGDHPLAVNEESGECSYNPAVNGGCAIGCFLGDNYRPEMDKAGGVESLFSLYPEVAEMFEDASSSFWGNLQMAHDTLAFFSSNKQLVQWERFVAALTRIHRQMPVTQ